MKTIATGLRLAPLRPNHSIGPGSSRSAARAHRLWGHREEVIGRAGVADGDLRALVPWLDGNRP